MGEKITVVSYKVQQNRQEDTS